MLESLECVKFGLLMLSLNQAPQFATVVIPIQDRAHFVRLRYRVNVGEEAVIEVYSSVFS